jgi:cytochrome aa3-600 menaquinol oxidase subunit 1
MMVYSMVLISALSFIVWLHHFFTMGAGPAVNSFFGVSTMLIAIPTGVKIFNWLFTLYRSKIRFTVAHMWALAFIPNFVIGGLTGVMLAVAPADYQYHNSYFLIAHFHYVLIAGTVFGVFSGLHYWWPKMFGHVLNEKMGKWAFWLWVIGFNVCFMPMYFVGLQGMTRRMYTYPANAGWTTLNQIETVGAFLMGIGFIVMVYMIYWSARYGERDLTGDPWDGRTLEWMTTSPAAEYNFAVVPHAAGIDSFWEMKKNGEIEKLRKQPIKEIHMPDNSGRPILISLAFFVAGFGLVFGWIWMAIIGLVGVILGLVLRSFENDEGHHIPVDVIERTEREAGRL